MITVKQGILWYKIYFSLWYDFYLESPNKNYTTALPGQIHPKKIIPQHRQVSLAEKKLYHSIAQLARPKKIIPQL